MKAALYIRNSTSEDRQNPETQLYPLRQYCQDRQLDYEVFQEFASGAKQSRPKLDLMMQGVRSRQFNKVIVWRLDRLGRSLKHLLQLIEEFRNKDVEFISLQEGFNTETAQGELFFNIAASFAQFERALIQERINAGLSRAKAEGKRLGRPKGSKDKKRRRKSGYYQRWSNRRH